MQHRMLSFVRSAQPSMCACPVSDFTRETHVCKPIPSYLDVACPELHSDSHCIKRSLPYLYSAGDFSLLRVSAYISLLETCIRFPEAVIPACQIRHKQLEIYIPWGIALSQWLIGVHRWPLDIASLNGTGLLHKDNFPLVKTLQYYKSLIVLIQWWGEESLIQQASAKLYAD